MYYLFGRGLAFSLCMQVFARASSFFGLDKRRKSEFHIYNGKLERKLHLYNFKRFIVIERLVLDEKRKGESIYMITSENRHSLGTGINSSLKVSH